MRVPSIPLLSPAHYYEDVPGREVCPDLINAAANILHTGDIAAEVGATHGRTAAYASVQLLRLGEEVIFYVATPTISILHDEMERSPLPLVFQEPDPARFGDGTIGFLVLMSLNDGDLARWLPKVKPGGMIAGIDYQLPDVADLVEAQFDEFEVWSCDDSDVQYWSKTLEA